MKLKFAYFIAQTTFLYKFWQTQAWVVFSTTSTAFIGPILERSSAYLDSDIFKLVERIFFYPYVLLLVLIYLKKIKSRRIYWSVFLFMTLVQILASIAININTFSFQQPGKLALGIYQVLVLVVFYTFYFYIIRAFFKSPKDTVFEEPTI